MFAQKLGQRGAWQPAQSVAGADQSRPRFSGDSGMIPDRARAKGRCDVVGVGPDQICATVSGGTQAGLRTPRLSSKGVPTTTFRQGRATRHAEALSPVPGFAIASGMEPAPCVGQRPARVKWASAQKRNRRCGQMCASAERAETAAGNAIPTRHGMCDNSNSRIGGSSSVQSAVPDRATSPDLSFWADPLDRAGRWPTHGAGSTRTMATWNRVDSALRAGFARPCPKGSSLARLLEERRGVAQSGLRTARLP